MYRKCILLISISASLFAGQKENPFITLVSNDNQEFPVPLSSALHSGQLKALLEQPALTQESKRIVFKEIKGSTVAVIAELMHNMQKHPALKGKKLVEALAHDQKKYDWLVNLLHAVHFLDFPLGLAFTAHTISTSDSGLLEAMNIWIGQHQISHDPLEAFKHYYFLVSGKKFFHCPPDVPLEKYVASYLCQKEMASLQEYLDYQPEMIATWLQKSTVNHELDLKRYGLNGIEGLATLASIDTLTTLDISCNFLAKIESSTFKPLINLKKLNLEGNSLHTIKKNAFEGLQSLEELVLRKNNVCSIKKFLKPLTCLRVLDVSHNNIHSLHPESFIALNNLTQLFLNDNQLTTLNSGQFSFLTNLYALNLNNNHIETIGPDSFKGLITLKELSLVKNKLITLTTDQWKGLDNMGYLNVSHNNIVSLTEDSFPLLNSLEYLYLSGNPLSFFDPAIVQQLPHLRRLALIGCQLTTFDPSLFPKLILIYLAQNPLAPDQNENLKKNYNVTYKTSTDDVCSIS